MNVLFIVVPLGNTMIVFRQWKKVNGVIGWKAEDSISSEPYGQFATNVRQTFHVTTNGIVSIEKHGNVISRGTNDVVTLNGVIQNGQ